MEKMKKSVVKQIKETLKSHGINLKEGEDIIQDWGYIEDNDTIEYDNFFKRVKETDFELRAYKFPENCWKCGKEYNIIIPFLFINGSVADCNGVRNDCLSWFDSYPNIKKVHSKTVNADYYANVCPHCGMFMGDWYLAEAGMGFIYYLHEYNYVDTVLKTDKLFYDNCIRECGKYTDLCLLCGKELSYYERKLTQEKISFSICRNCWKELYQKPNEKYCETCSVKFQGKNPNLNCKHCHHVRYFPPKTMAVCRKCHLKIHSNSPDLNKYKPIDGNIDMMKDL